jgi:peptide/nickel transport system permease protein
MVSALKRKLVRELLLFLPTTLLIALIAFSVMYFSPGRPALSVLLAKNPLGGVSEETVVELEEKLGLNLSYWDQFGMWLKGAAHGDFGESFQSGLPVLREFSNRFGCTLLLALMSVAIAAVIALIFGNLCAYFRSTLLDRAVTAIASVNTSLPSFWVALLLLWVFAIRLHWFPAYGFTSLRDLVLPSIAIALPVSGTIFRVVRGNAAEAQGSAWMYTLRGKGIHPALILCRHTLKNIAIPVLTQTTNCFILVLGITMVVERIFGLPGIGSFLAHAVLMKDIPVVSGFVFAVGMLVITVNLGLEVVYSLIDPRTRI